jgi:hypothetical protein
MPIQLHLTTEQRLNLELLCGQQRGDVRTISCYVRIMDTIRLNEEEKIAINFRLEGNAYRFDLPPSAASRSYALETQDTKELKTMLTTYNQFAASDLRWLEPVLQQLNQAGV